jgi:hypothetical protein
MRTALAGLIKSCEAETTLGMRPSDVFPINQLIAIFLVRADLEENWMSRVKSDIWYRLGRHTQEAFYF